MTVKPIAGYDFQVIQSQLDWIDAGVSSLRDNLLSNAAHHPLEIPSVSECVEIMEQLDKISQGTHAIIRYTTDAMKQHLTQERKEK